MDIKIDAVESLKAPLTLTFQCTACTVVLEETAQCSEKIKSIFE